MVKAQTRQQEERFQSFRDQQPPLRTTPQQRRANETVARLLDASRELIEERGIEGFNTNLLAERCGVRVRSVYRYFDNKQAIVVTLYRQLTEDWHPFFEEGFLRIGDPGLDWREEVDSLGRDFLEILRGSPAAVAIRKAMKTDARLVEAERADNALLGERFAEAVLPRVSDIQSEHLARVGRTWLNAISVLADIGLDCEPEEQQAQFTENQVLQSAYLAIYLD